MVHIFFCQLTEKTHCIFFPVFTGKGYFVICINPTGSTTFGQDLTDAITEDWGGKPFVDLINGWTYALEKYPEVCATLTLRAVY